MKKILTLAIAAATIIASSLFGEVKAQSTNTVTRTITAADTITWSPAGSRVRGFQYTFTETSGTTAGKVYLEGTINGTWVTIDSLTLADVTTPQTKVFPNPASTGTTYRAYRFRNTNTSNATGTATGSYLRRTDD